MSVRFAAPVFAFGAKMNSATIYGVARKAVNDNPRANRDGKTQPSETLDAALRYFADHGLAAARNARKQAEQALDAGDEANYDTWLEICRSLDRRMARELDRSKTMDDRKTATI